MKQAHEIKTKEDAYNNAIEVCREADARKERALNSIPIRIIGVNGEEI